MASIPVPVGAYRNRLVLDMASMPRSGVEMPKPRTRASGRGKKHGMLRSRRSDSSAWRQHGRRQYLSLIGLQQQGCPFAGRLRRMQADGLPAP